MRAHTDRYGRTWRLPKGELCPECGQPDSCGDCNHKKLPLDKVKELGGKNEAKTCPCNDINESTEPCQRCYKNVWREREERAKLKKSGGVGRKADCSRCGDCGGGCHE